MEHISRAVHSVFASAMNRTEARNKKDLLNDAGRTPFPSEYPEGSVTLHKLCNACITFTQSSRAIKWLDESQFDSPWPPRVDHRLCTVAHLRRLNGHCHLCTILYFYVTHTRTYQDQAQDLDKQWLYLDISSVWKPSEHGSIKLIARLYPTHDHVTTFDLRVLEGM